MSAQLSIAVLGDEFSYHHLAAMDYFGKNNSFLFCANFDALTEEVQNGRADHSVIAVYNSLAGEVPGNFERIVNSNLFITGEINLHIQLCLGALPGTALEEIRTVYSHEMGWKETSGFFSHYPAIRFVETPSTASAARIISEQQIKHAAALTSRSALSHYGLDIIMTGIDNHPDNHTRFFILSLKSSLPKTTNKMLKASLLLQFHDNRSERSFAELLKPGENLFLKPLSDGRAYVEVELTDPSQIDLIVNSLHKNQCIPRVIGVYEKGATLGEL